MGQTDEQKDGRTLNRYINPAVHTASTTAYQIVNFLLPSLTFKVIHHYCNLIAFSNAIFLKQEFN